MYSITRNADDSFHDKEAMFGWREKNHDVPLADVAIGHQRPDPACRQRKLLAIDEYMVTNEQRVLHGTGRNFKCLQDERDNE